MNEASEHHQYRMAGRARSAAVFRPGERLALQYVVDGERIELSLRTRYFDKGFEDHVPGDIWLDARGHAPDLHRAISVFGNAGRVLASIVALCSNAAIAPIEPELAYDSTPELTERQFFQRFVPDEPLHVVSSRFVPVEATREVVAAIESHQDKERILRAVGQYSVTLEHWSLGSELLAVAHLFMGAEALKTACWKHAVRQGSNSSEQLAQEWGFDGRPRLNEFLDREARVRLVFGGDKTCHRKAKEISDGFEHGYANPGSLFDPAREVLIATARHIRRAVFSILEITEDTRRVLENDRYNRPRGLPKLEAYLHGTLTNAANAEALAAAGNEHPIFSWSRQLAKVKYDPETDTYGFSPKESLTAFLGEGVRCRPDRMELWDGASITSPADTSSSE